MIITNDKHFPRVIMKFDKFYELELRTLINEINILDIRAKKNDTFINYYFDLYDLSDYSFLCVTRFIGDIIQKKEPLYINKVVIYLDEMRDNSNIFMLYDLYKDSIGISIDILEIGEPIKIK